MYIRIEIIHNNNNLNETNKHKKINKRPQRALDRSPEKKVKRSQWSSFP